MFIANHEIVASSQHDGDDFFNLTNNRASLIILHPLVLLIFM